MCVTSRGVMLVLWVYMLNSIKIFTFFYIKAGHKTICSHKHLFMMSHKTTGYKLTLQKEHDCKQFANLNEMKLLNKTPVTAYLGKWVILFHNFACKNKVCENTIT